MKIVDGQLKPYITPSPKFVIERTDEAFIITLKHAHKRQYEALMSIEQQPYPTYVGAAAQLNIPVNTLKTRIHRARQRILGWRRERDLNKEHANERPLQGT